MNTNPPNGIEALTDVSDLGDSRDEKLTATGWVIFRDFNLAEIPAGLQAVELGEKDRPDDYLVYDPNRAEIASWPSVSGTVNNSRPKKEDGWEFVDIRKQSELYVRKKPDVNTVHY